MGTEGCPGAKRARPTASSGKAAASEVGGGLGKRLGGILAVAAIFSAASLLAAEAYGRFAVRVIGPPSHAPPVPAVPETGLDRAVAPLTDSRPGETGLALLTDNLDAFAARALAARQAGRSLDLLYYQWSDDLTGRLLALDVLRAADRGVRVRVLVDDMNAPKADRLYRALDLHPMIEVRMFNPGRNREGGIGRAVELLLRATALNRRMHNKAWIADGRVAIAGGRNIGDAYFDAAEDGAFLDADLLAVGPIVADAARMFDAYWNSPVVIPHAALHEPDDPAASRAELDAEALVARARPYLARVAASDGVRELRRGERGLHWTRAARLLADPPAKARQRGRDGWIVHDIVAALHSARAEISISSPYFVPGDAGVALLADLRARGVETAILTNSLAATDVAVVHAGYAPYRRPLLEAGIELYELRPRSERSDDPGLFGSGRASLHTKAFVLDRRAGFVGSFNFDPRSANLNTEMGILFEEPGLALALRDQFARRTAPPGRWRLFLQDGRLRWAEDDVIPPRIRSDEPKAGFGRRLIAALLGLLPIEAQL